MADPRHSWKATGSTEEGQEIQQCSRCETERRRDPATKGLFFFRGGRAIGPRRIPMHERGYKWHAFVAGVTPKCTGPDQG